MCVEHRVREERLSTAFFCDDDMHARRTFAGPSARAHILSYIFENYPLCVGHDINDLGFFPSRGTLAPSAGQEYGTECNSDAILTTSIYYYVQ